MCEDCEAIHDLSTLGRRQFFGIAAVAATFTAGMARAEQCVTFTADLQSATTPDQALQNLADGNARFVAGKAVACDLRVQAAATAAKQNPFACVLACIDSRSPPELVFDQQLGDIFVARVAGNVPTVEIIGSFEFATKVSGAKAILVIGHNDCGAIKGAIDNAVVGNNLTTLLHEIEPAVLATPLTGERSSKNAAFVQAVNETNVRMGVAALTAQSAVLKALVDAGQLKIVGGLFDLKSGVVTLLT